MDVTAAVCFSFEAGKYGAKEVIGIDADDKNIEQANAIKKYLGTKNVKFLKLTAEEISEKDLGKFDITILTGILYHLEDPIGVMKRISEVTISTLLIDSHVHYSTEQSEDIPSWWMLNDMDKNDLEGLFVGDEILSKEKYARFERQTKVDYGKLQDQFIPSPHTAAVSKRRIPNCRAKFSSASICIRDSCLNCPPSCHVPKYRRLNNSIFVSSFSGCKCAKSREQFSQFSLVYILFVFMSIF